MALSIFEVAGPVMIGPSSSHTAGAVRLGRMSALLCEGEITRAEFHLYGSFGKTYRGHGTDLALVAGVLGMAEDDERLSRSFEIARERGVDFSFIPEERKMEHDNYVTTLFTLSDGTERTVSGVSLGGGRIMITELDGFNMELGCEKPTAVIVHRDERGMLGHLTGALGFLGLNIGIMRSTRNEKGAVAVSVIECDEHIPAYVKDTLMEIGGVVSVTIINPEEAESVI